jgi:hypothetical protein
MTQPTDQKPDWTTLLDQYTKVLLVQGRNGALVLLLSAALGTLIYVFWH